MKNRKGFAKININGKKFLFNWANNPEGPMLIMYASDTLKFEIPFIIWKNYPESEEYLSKYTKIGKEYVPPTWHGKHKKGAEWGSWGKREAREMYFKYLRYIEDCAVFLC
jgi:hypothetical protein